MVSLSSFLFLSFVLFLTGLMLVLGRKSIIFVLIGLELILNAAALNFVAYSRFVTEKLDGHLFALFIIVIAAAEAAVALALAIRFYQLKETTHLDELSELKH